MGKIEKLEEKVETNFGASPFSHAEMGHKINEIIDYINAQEDAKQEVIKEELERARGFFENNKKKGDMENDR